MVDYYPLWRLQKNMPDDNKTTDTNPTPTQDVSGVGQTIPPMEPSISTPIPPPVSPTDQGQTTDAPPSAANSTVPPPPPIIEEQKEGKADIPPIVTTGGKPKGKVSKKVIATILGILFLVGGVSAGVILVQQQQDIREKASGCGWGGTIGAISCSGYAQSVVCSDPKDSCNSYLFPAWCDLETCDNEEVCVVGSGCVKSQLPTSTPRPTGEVSDNCVFVTENPYCVGNNPTGDCYQGGEGDRYACYQLAGNSGKIVDTTASRTDCNCPSDYSWKRNEYGYTWCFDTSERCTGGVLPNGTDTSEQCSLEPEQCEPSSTPTPGPTSTPTPTPTETYASCLEVQAFDTEWDPIVDLSSLVAGDVVRFTVAGDTNSGSFDKARFRINSPTWRTVVVAKKPGTNSFYDEYTIPEGVTSFTINVQLHHTDSDISWF